MQTTDEALATKLPVRETYPEEFRCPLLDYPTPFLVTREILGLDVEIAQVLDEIRPLTTLITAPMLDPATQEIETAKIRAKAACM